ncbi:MAG: glycosyltransferase [bacterium]
MVFLACFWGLLAVYISYCVFENILLFAKPEFPPTQRKKWPKVSLLIPARDEQARITPCLKSLLAQDYPAFEILVLDDRSTDETFKLVQSFARRDKRLKVIRGKELPKGWLGKPWACSQLAQKAKGEWFFFTDADTWHKPEMLKRTVAMAESRKADVLTLLTRQVTQTWMEALVVPVMAFHLLAFFPAKLSLRPKSFFNRFAGVSGQFVFVRAEAYRDFGGHTTVKHEIVEDLNFGKRAVAAGLKLVYGDGSDFSFCRMYTNVREVWEGFSKNFFAALGFSPFLFLNSLVVLLVGGVLPFVVLFFGWGTVLWPGALILCLALWTARWVQAARYDMSRWSVLFHPVGCLLFAAIGVNSVLWSWRRKGQWKGRVLPHRS